MKKKILFFASILIINCQLSITNCMAQPQLWGMTQSGGQDDLGVIFKADSIANSETVEQSFLLSPPGAYPQRSKLLQATDGMLYGMTNAGGANNVGVIFQYNPVTDIYTKKIDLTISNGSNPYGSLIQAADGMLYGMTYQGGSSSAGVIFQYDPVANIYTKKIDLNGNTGYYPLGSLVEATDGMLYALTSNGGNGYGVIFQYNTSTNTLIKKVNLSSTNGSNPNGSLIQATDGMLYGMTYGGGANNVGVVFQYNPTTDTYTKKIDLSVVNGSNPNGSLIQASNGMLYGMTYLGGTNNVGVLFQYDPVVNSFTKKFDFNGIANGSNPNGSLMEASDGMLYGMTSGGGLNSLGTLFQYNTSTNIYSKKQDFNFNNGSLPNGTLMQASDGMLYGTTTEGGVNGVGIIFQYDYSTNINTGKFNFDLNNGSTPKGSLIQASDGKLYGMTSSSEGKGNIFQFDPLTSIYTNKFNFTGLATGSFPYGSLMQASDGMLYGMTNQGGANNVGVLFQFDPFSNIYTKKVDFDVNNGQNPVGSLIQAKDGMLYGMAQQGGANGTGVLFRYNISSNSYTVMYDFDVSTGSYPSGSLIQASDGKLYGTTLFGGSDYGVLFQYDPVSNAYSKKLNFYPSHGNNPTGSLVQASDGKIYGTTQSGGVYGNGVMFQYDPVVNTYAKKLDFNGAGNGSNPYGALMQGSDGKLYGMTQNGGINNLGVMFQYNTLTNTYSKKLEFNGTNGKSPYYTNLVDISLSISTFELNASNCAGSSINVPYINTGVYNTGNVFTAELSDATGSFASPTSIGTYASTTASGTINAVIPLNSPLGTGYRIRVVSSSPATIGRDNGSNITINPYLNVTANASTSDSVCAGTSVILTGGGATTYTWTGNVTDGIGFVPYSTVIYTVTGTDGNGCTNTATKTITVNSLPTVFAYATATTVCSGSSITLSGLGTATSFAWTGGAIDGVPFIPSAATYTVTGTDDNGCSGTATKTISVNPVATVIANTSADTVCAGDSVTLTGTGTALTYNWSGGVTDGSGFIPSSTATYTVTGTSGNNCTTTATQIITVNPLPIVFASSTAAIVCSGTLITLSGIGNATSYVWTGGVTDGQAFVPTSTAYTVTGTDGNNCSNTALKSITVLPTSSNSQLAMICAGQSINVGSNTYSTSGTYTDVLISTNGCDSTVTTNLMVNDISVSVSNATLTAAASGAIYQWLDCNNGYSIIAGQTSQSYTPAAGGSFAVIVTENSCSDTSACYITTTGIDENNLAASVNIFPNPFSSQTTISFSEEQKNAAIKIMDVLGKEIKVIIFTGNQLIIEKAEMDAGIYFVQISTGKGSIIKKIIIN